MDNLDVFVTVAYLLLAIPCILTIRKLNGDGRRAR